MKGGIRLIIPKRTNQVTMLFLVVIATFHVPNLKRVSDSIDEPPLSDFENSALREKFKHLNIDLNIPLTLIDLLIAKEFSQSSLLAMPHDLTGLKSQLHLPKDPDKKKKPKKNDRNDQYRTPYMVHVCNKKRCKRNFK
jgi:hypothetical protein